MSKHVRLLRPAKRQRTERTGRLYEDDVKALDAVTVERTTIETKKGRVIEKTLVPIPPAKDGNNISEAFRANVDDEIPFCENPLPADVTEPAVPLEKRKAR
jgi:hypothetical protein